MLRLEQLQRKIVFRHQNANYHGRYLHYLNESATFTVARLPNLKEFVSTVAILARKQSLGGGLATTLELLLAGFLHWRWFEDLLLSAETVKVRRNFTLLLAGMRQAHIVSAGQL